MLLNHNKTLEILYYQQTNDAKIKALKEKHQARQDQMAAEA
jgi:hypothetical protein